MGLYSTLIFTTINIFCLAITLIMPNPSTPASLIPIIVYACLWIFKTKTGEFKISRIIRIGIIILALIIASVCFLIILTASIEKEIITEFVLKFKDASHQTGILTLFNANNSAGDYLIHFRPDVALLGSRTMHYGPFAITAFVSITFLLISDAIAATIYPVGFSSSSTRDVSIDTRMRNATKSKVRRKKS